LVSSLIATITIQAILRDAKQPAMPLDDSFIHFVFAKRFAEGSPFTFSPGDGYSSGATSFAWPLMLAPFYLLGLRGLDLVWAVWGLGTLLHAAVAVETKRLVEGIAGKAAGAGAAAMCLLFGAFTWFAWSGMETIGLAWAMTRAARMLADYAEQPVEMRSLRGALKVAAICALCPLMRPEGSLFAVTGAAMLFVLAPRSSDMLASLKARWPLLLPLLAVGWVPLVNLVMVGHTRGATAIVKWGFGNPYYDTQRFIAFFGGTVRMLWNDLLSGGPYTAIFMPEHSQYVFLLGGMALVSRTMRREKWARGGLIALLALGTLIPCTFLTILWNRVRYIYPFAPGWFALVAMLGAELGALVAYLRKESTPATWVPALVTGLFAGALSTKLGWSIADLANSSRAISEQQVKLGIWADGHLPKEARIGVNDTGAIAYFSNRRTFDVVGLTTEGEAPYWVAGTGSRYEHYERLAKTDAGRNRLPTHFIVYPQWMATPPLFGAFLFEATVENQSILGGATKTAYEADWSVLGRADLPEARPGAQPADEIDVSDLESEREHRYRLMPANDTDNALFSRWLEDGSEIADGGRKQRMQDDFDAELPAGAVLVGRFAAEQPVSLKVLVGTTEVATAELPMAGWAEIEIPLAGAGAGRQRVTIQSDNGKPFTAMHYWVYDK
jgi:hypothetical protein